MNELNPKDVMMALEHCTTETRCDGCPFDGRPYCDTDLIVSVLALLREKDARIEELEAELKEWRR